MNQKWEEKDNIIYFDVTSNGLTGEEHSTLLEKMGFNLESFVKNKICSSLKPTNGVITKIAVIKGSLFNHGPVVRNFLEESEKHNFLIPNIEIACLIREKVTDDEMENAMGI